MTTPTGSFESLAGIGMAMIPLDGIRSQGLNRRTTAPEDGATPVACEGKTAEVGLECNPRRARGAIGCFARRSKVGNHDVVRCCRSRAVDVPGVADAIPSSQSPAPAQPPRDAPAIEPRQPRANPGLADQPGQRFQAGNPFQQHDVGLQFGAEALVLVQHVQLGQCPARIDAERAQPLVLAGDVEPANPFAGPARPPFVLGPVADAARAGAVVKHGDRELGFVQGLALRKAGGDRRGPPAAPGAGNPPGQSRSGGGQKAATNWTPNSRQGSGWG